MKKESSYIEPELSRPLRVDHVPMGGIEEKIVASPSERDALIKRFGLVGMPRLEATLNVDRAEGHMFTVTGRLYAQVVQNCVVTLEPVEETVDEIIDVIFAPAHLLKNDRDGSLPDLGDAEPPEPIENGIIDLGELTAQHLATSLNPYPRKPGAELPPIENGAEDDSKPAALLNPFAVLKEKDKLKN